jgi:hypothetical protein
MTDTRDEECDEECNEEHNRGQEVTKSTGYHGRAVGLCLRLHDAIGPLSDASRE